MSTRPELIHQFSHHLAARWRDQGYENIAVYADVRASLSGRFKQLLIDPNANLIDYRHCWHTASCVLPLQELLKIDSQNGQSHERTRGT